MTSVASQSISQELHRLSGWEDVRDWWWGHHLKGGDIRYEVMQNAPVENCGRDDSPAYDLGYLLRKLQERPRIELKQMSGLRWVASTKFGVLVDTPDHDVEVRDFDGIGYSPEDAAAKLAIELFKQGVLTRGSDE